MVKEEYTDWMERMALSDDENIQAEAGSALSDPAKWENFVASRIRQETGTEPTAEQLAGIEEGRQRLITRLFQRFRDEATTS
jgi:hypothetical protein